MKRVQTALYLRSPQLPINLEVLDICSNMEAPSKVAMPHKASAHSKIYSTGLRPQIKRDRWKTEEDTTVLQMRNDGCSWKDIHVVLPHRSIGTIQVPTLRGSKGSIAESDGANRRHPIGAS
jgi:hypothetical protein